MSESSTAAFYEWKPAAWLRVTGEDAASFLQGQLTNDLRGLVPGGAVYGLWLNVKGKVVADSFVVRGKGAGAMGGGEGDAERRIDGSGAEFWVGSYFSSGAVIRERLESFIIADDVTLEDVTGEWAGMTLCGGGVGDAAVGEEETSLGGVRYCGRRGGAEVVEWVFPSAQREAARAQVAGWREIGVEEMEARRIAGGIPAVPVDIGPGDLPGEGALEGGAISYTKGCYLGQEVMARLKSMGQVRRRLLRVAGEGAVPAKLPADLFIGARRVGEVRSAVRVGVDGGAGSERAGGGGGVGGEKEGGRERWTGLAMLSLMHVSGGAGTALAWAAEAVPTVTLTEAP